MLNVILNNNILAADSLRSASITKDTSRVTSLFTNHLLSVKTGETKLHVTTHYYLLTFILFLSFLIFVGLYVYNSSKIKLVIKGFYVNRFANQIAREESYFTSKSTYLLTLIFVFSVSLFISKVFQFYGINFISPTYSVIYISIGILLMYTVKILSVVASGNIFKVSTQVNEYVVSIFLFCNSLGLFLLPVVICLIFAKQLPAQIFIYAGFALIGIFYFTRIIRGLLIGMRIVKSSRLYLFLYLCTLEILPIIIIVKLFLLKTK